MENLESLLSVLLSTPFLFGVSLLNSLVIFPLTTCSFLKALLTLINECGLKVQSKHTAEERGWKNWRLALLPGFSGSQQQLEHQPVFVGIATRPPPFSLYTSVTRSARTGQTFKSWLFLDLVFHSIKKKKHICLLCKDKSSPSALNIKPPFKGDHPQTITQEYVDSQLLQKTVTWESLVFLDGHQID